MVNFDWHSIRSLNGTQAHGFEELCAQLARSEKPSNATFVRKGSPDAGVECYCSLPDGTEWGWQAKYFSTLENSQWSQLDHSVRRALEKHPNLARYFICIPRDRSDGRIDGQLSALEKWNERVEKWQGWADDRGMDVEFIWWGASELVERLSHPEHVGRVWFWFDSTAFTQQWFEDRLDESIRAAGPRYTPEINVELEITDELKAFGQSESVINEVKGLAPSIQQEFQDVRRGRTNAENDETKLALDRLLEFQIEIRRRFSTLEATPEGIRELADLEKALTDATETAEQAEEVLFESESDDEQDDSDAEVRPTHPERPFRDLPERVFRLRSTLLRAHSQTIRINRLANSNLMILNGDAGTGKSHLLCDFASDRIGTGAPTVLLMGNRFRDSSEPWTQILQQVGMQDANTEMLVGALEAAAQAANQRALVMIDALNESEGWRMWPDHLPSFLARVDRSPWIATLLSVRSTYEKLVIPDEVREQAEVRTHPGFSGREYDAMRKFFTYYGIEFPSTPILRPEFSNPLFLKLICKALELRGQSRMPRGFSGITATFEYYLKSVNDRLAESLDYNVNDHYVREALVKISEYLEGHGTRWIPREEAERALNELLPRQGHSQSLLNGLVSEGVLYEDILWSGSGALDNLNPTPLKRFWDPIVGACRGMIGSVVGRVRRAILTKESECPDDIHVSERGSDVIAQYYMAAGLEPPRSVGNSDESEPQEVVYISYERFVDHIVAKRLIDRHLGVNALTRGFRRIFRKGRELAALGLGEMHTSRGLIEAMCIQVPERTGKELVSLASDVVDNPHFREAFVQSIVWRNLNAFSDETTEVLEHLMREGESLPYVMDRLLTVSIVPGHKFNAEYLDGMLRRDTMPERDRWWSTYLHYAHGNKGAVDRILDWVLDESSPSTGEVEESVLELTGTTLAWMLTSSNRFVRDRTTKALVALFSNRLIETKRLVERFSDVDDPYVAERIYGAAYGVAMRSHDSIAVGQLASTVYEAVFASGSPPAHILLREYARGVVERAIYLGAELNIEMESVRPPYTSEWPEIPSEDDIDALISELCSRERCGEQSELGWRRIRSSVMGGDFSSYVIGDNSRWLNVSLDDPPWQSPDDRLSLLLSECSDSEFEAWEDYRQSDRPMPIIIGTQDPNGGVTGRTLLVEGRMISLESEDSEESEEAESILNQHRQNQENALRDLLSRLTPEHRDRMEVILHDRADRDNWNRHRMDMNWIRRYVLWRVFDLGWTTDNFGTFDERVNMYHSRNPDKPERIGKKYQWIAFHEILAYISDHFQYRQDYANGDRAYLGTWQEGLRDIDPSCLMPETPIGESSEGHRQTWWSQPTYEAWDAETGHEEWVARDDDLPNAQELVGAVSSADGERWIPISTYVCWEQPVAANIYPLQVEKRELWMILTGYFVKSEDADAFIDWTHRVDFWGRWMPEKDGFYLYYTYLGEYGWSPAFKHYNRRDCSEESSQDWTIPKPRGDSDQEDCPVAVRLAHDRYNAESSTSDCSVADGYSLRVPHHELLSSLGLRWSGHGADYVDRAGRLAAFDPSAHEEGPPCLLIREDLLNEYLEREGLALCWTVLGEKWVIGMLDNRSYPGALRLTGAYRHTEDGPDGNVRMIAVPPKDG